MVTHSKAETNLKKYTNVVTNSRPKFLFFFFTFAVVNSKAHWIKEIGKKKVYKIAVRMFMVEEISLSVCVIW